MGLLIRISVPMGVSHDMQKRFITFNILTENYKNLGIVAYGIRSLKIATDVFYIYSKVQEGRNYLTGRYYEKGKREVFYDRKMVNQNVKLKNEFGVCSKYFYCIPFVQILK